MQPAFNWRSRDTAPCGDMASAVAKRSFRLLPANHYHLLELASAESSVDDFDTCRGDVLIRAVTILRYIESQPPTGRFVES